MNDDVWVEMVIGLLGGVAHAEIQELIRGMGDQYIEVILADGGYIKYLGKIQKQHR